MCLFNEHHSLLFGFPSENRHNMTIEYALREESIDFVLTKSRKFLTIEEEGIEHVVPTAYVVPTTAVLGVCISCFDNIMFNC